MEPFYKEKKRILQFNNKVSQRMEKQQGHLCRFVSMRHYLVKWSLITRFPNAESEEFFQSQYYRIHLITVKTTFKIWVMNRPSYSVLIQTTTLLCKSSQFADYWLKLTFTNKPNSWYFCPIS